MNLRVVSRTVEGQIPRKKEKGCQIKDRKQQQKGRKVMDVGRRLEAGSHTLVGVFSGHTQRGYSDFRLPPTSEGKS